MQPKVLLIVGPTGIGKTDVSLRIAARASCEIISADSRQIYKYMDIGTAKPSREELAAVPHHFISIKTPDETYSAGEFGEDARRCVDDIFARGRLPLVVGGSGLYIRGLVDGFSGPRVADAGVKARLREQLQEQGLEFLYARLQALDRETASRLNPGDTQRILRALEVQEITGKPFSDHLKSKSEPADFEPVFAGLTMERAELYERIERRVDRMLAMGLVAEVRRLRQMGYGPELNALRTVGYQEVFLYLRDELNYDDMAALIKQKSRNYAKRQLTWFGKDERIVWFDVGESDVDVVARQTIRLLN